MSEVLVIDDQSTSRLLMSKLLVQVDPNLQIHGFANAIEALDWCKENEVDLILVDYSMPGMNGIDFTEKFRKIPFHRDVPVVMITISEDEDVRLEALEIGATDFLNKPIDHFELRARVQNLLSLRRHQKIARQRLHSLEDEVNYYQKLMKESSNKTRNLLLTLLAQKGIQSPTASEAVIELSRIISTKLALRDINIELLTQAAPLYALGKHAITDHIMHKNGPLTEFERKQVQKHCHWGDQLLREDSDPMLQMAADMALYYQENHDGSGYPSGLTGDKIPVSARIIHLVDACIALASDRPWRAAWDNQAIFDWIEKHQGQFFDPEIVAILLEERDDVCQILDQCRVA